ncbi:MAG: retention module-containing protein, partial [bacterium]
IYGTVKAVAPDGTVRVLAPNSPVFADEKIITDSDGSVSIMLDGPPPTQLDLGRMTEMVLDQDVYAGATPEAVTESTAEAEKIQEALLQGDQPIELEATAAGGAGDTGGGHPIVNFALTGSEVTPGSGADTTGYTSTIAGTQEGVFVLGAVPANEGPIAVADEGTAVEAGVVAGSDAIGNVLANDTDVDAGDTKTLTTIGVFEGKYGTLTLNADGSYTYVIDNSNAAVDALRLSTDTLSESFDYTMVDAAGAESSSTLTITIQGANDGPIAFANVGTAVEAGVADGSDAIGNVLTNDTDVDAGDTKTVTTIGEFEGTYGSLHLNSDGSYTYAIDNSNEAVDALRLSTDTLSDSFDYTMKDAAGAESTATLTITIQGANDGPIAFADSGTAVEAGVAAGSDAEGNVLANDTDVDAGDTKTVTTTGEFEGEYGTLHIDANGDYTYAVNNTNEAVDALRLSTDTLSESFDYTMKDTAGAESTAKLTITIHGANDAPDAVDDFGTAALGHNAEGNVLTDVATGDTDVDAGDILTVTQVSDHDGPYIPIVGETTIAGDYGTLTIDSSGHYDYVTQTTVVESEQNVNVADGPVTAYGFGSLSEITDSDGDLIIPTGATAGQHLVMHGGVKAGIGVDIQNGSGAIDRGEAILLDLHQDTTAVKVTLAEYNLNQGNTASWHAYNAEGEEVGSDVFVSTHTNGLPETFTISTSESFQHLVITDNSDENNSQGVVVVSIEIDNAVSVSDVFHYEITDLAGATDLADLTIDTSHDLLVTLVDDPNQPS